ncbi:hypothetical protein CDD83_2761 [Cordyceps sp. RAO-2017]|nr:hypothetical protein CDD83_2761 [Cordyceps sp. RAO-2017]
MGRLSRLFLARPAPDLTLVVVAAAAAATAILSLYHLCVRPALGERSTTARVRRCEAREAARLDPAAPETWPYPPHVFPGAHDVETEVMLFDVPFDDRLYTTQILLVLVSSPLPWTGSAAFHLLGYSLGGGLAASFAAHRPHIVRSLTLVCPGGIVRTSHVSLKSRLLYSESILPACLVNALARGRLQPRRGASADVPEGETADVDFDDVPLSTSRKAPTVGDAVGWQLRGNSGFVGAYMSTIRHAPIHGQHEKVWRLLSQQLARRRRRGHVPESQFPPGLVGGKICLILAERDPIVIKDEWIEESKTVLGEDGRHVFLLGGGHGIAISRGREVAAIARRA